MYGGPDWWRFALGLAVVSIPAALLENSDSRWAWRYVALILLALVIFYWSGLGQFARFMTRELGGR